MMMPLPQESSPTGMAPAFGPRTGMYLPQFMAQQRQKQLQASGDNIAQPDDSMRPPASMFPSDAWQKVQEPYNKSMGVGGKLEGVQNDIQSSNDAINNTMTSKDYNPSVLRKILGVGAAMLGGGMPAYENITEMPRNRALGIQNQKLAGFQRIQGILNQQDAAYKNAGTDLTAALDPIARHDATQATMWSEQQKADAPGFDKVDFTGPNGEKRTGQMSNKVARGGRWQPGMMAPNSVAAPIEYENKNVIDPANGMPSIKPMPKVPVPGQAQPNYMPIPSNATESFYNMTPAQGRTPKAYSAFERSTQQPNQQLAVFEAEMAEKKQSQYLTDKLEGVAWDYYRGASQQGGKTNLTDFLAPARAKQAVQTDPNIPPDQKEAVKANIDKIFQKMIGLTPTMDREDLLSPGGGGMPAPGTPTKPR